MIVIKKSIYPAPRIVLDADAFAVTPATNPLNDTTTVNAFAFVAGLFDNETWTTKVVPATYVPFPVRYVGAPVIASAACALMLTLNPLLGPALNARAEISSLPETVAVIDSAWLVVPAAIVIKKSMYPVPLIVFDTDEFAVTPATSPPKAAVTVNAFADAAGLLNETRTTNVIPATYVPFPVRYVGAPVIASAACALIAMIKLLVGGFSARLVISSVPDTVVVIVTVGWLDAPASIVIKKSMYPGPLIVFEVDPFAEIPVAPPKDRGAVTVSAFADVAGLFNATRTTNVVPATYVPFPLKAVKLVMESVACALIFTFNALLGPALSTRAEISSLPETDAVIDSDWLAVPAVIVIKKSMFPVPLIVFDADPFAVTPATSPANDAVTVNAFADVAGLLNDTRTTNVIPATYVPFPVWNVGAPVIVRVACALILMPNAALGPALSDRTVISSLPEIDAVIDNAWLTVPAAIVIKKSMFPVPLIVFDADPFAVTPATSPANDAVTVNAFADAAGLLKETRTTKVIPATYVPFPVWNVGAPLIARAACALIAMI